MNNFLLETPRLWLRQWQASDKPLFASMNTDPEVMRHFPSTLNRTESDAFVDRISALIDERGWDFWAIELKLTREFIGFTGLHTLRPEYPFAPGVEIGWRLAKAYWGHGYATEAAAASLRYGFEQLQLSEVFSFTTVGNRRSQAVMQRLAMVNTQHNFTHPNIPASHPLAEHVLYKITEAQWRVSLNHKHK